MNETYRYIPVQINPITAFLLRRKGKRDGKIGIPKPDGAGEWISSKLRRELDAFELHVSTLWFSCETATAPLRQEVGRLEEQNARADIKLDAIRNQIDDYYSNPVYAECRKCEDKLDQTAIRRRRILESGNIPESALCVEINNLTQTIHDNMQKIRGLNAQIAAIEHQTQLNSEKTCNHMRGRISAYWDGVLYTHPDKECPPVPKFPHLSSRDSYLKLHGLEAIV